MLKKFAVISIFLALFSCDHSLPSNDKGSGYFELQTLLDAQYLELSVSDRKIEKEVSIDGESETLSIEPDTAIWRSELLVFEPFDPGKARFANAFQVTELKGGVRYEKKPDEKQSLQWVEVFQEGDDLSFRAEIIEEASIYTLKKKVAFEIRSGILTNYALEGYQKMLLRDTSFFQLKATLR